jgi:hypothetical protein
MKFKTFFSVLFLLLLAVLFTSRVNAQTHSPNYLNTNPDVPQNFHTYVQTVFIEVASAVSCQLAGIDLFEQNGKCLGIDPKTQKIGFVDGGGGAISLLGSFITMTFYMPVSTYDYGSFLASKFGIAKDTYAADTLPPGTNTQPTPTNDTGVGFRALLPTLKLWQTFRNVAYLLFVILFVIIGLGIMFRIRIDPRTVMTIQNQIPKIIIALVLVTFSYAIAGFMVDLMYVFIYLIVSLFAEQGTDPTSALATNPFGAIGGFGGISGIASGVAKSISGIVASIFDGTLGNLVGAIVGAIIGQLLPNPASGIPVVGGLVATGKFLIGGLLGGLFGNEIVGLIAGVISYLVIVIAIFTALLRLWFQLIKAYIFVLIMVVFAPFYIAFGLVPGRSGFGNWIRGLLANLSAFPATITMFLLGKAFMSGFTGGAPGSTPFAPPLVGDFLRPDRFASIIGLGIILLTPEVVNMVKEALKAPEFKFTSSIGRSLAVGPGMAAQTGRFWSIARGYELKAGGVVDRVGFLKGFARAFLGG